MKLAETYAFVQAKIQALQAGRTTALRVGINGIEGTGKTFFAQKLTTYLQENGLLATHVTIDGFHYNSAHRWKQGRNSAKGYYEDAYDEQAFIDKVLNLSQSIPAQYIPATHDLDTDQYLNLKPIKIPTNSVLITDGAYLFKTIFQPHWDLSIYLKTSFETAMERGVKRDLPLFGTREKTREKYLKRYHAASKLYIADHQPEHFATIIFDNTDLDDWKLVKG